MKRVAVIDSHTAGEPTRVVVSGGPDLGGGPVAQLARLKRELVEEANSLTPERFTRLLAI